MTIEVKPAMNNFLASVLVALLAFFGVVFKEFYDDRKGLEARMAELEQRSYEEHKLRQAADLLAMDLRYRLQKSVNQLDVIQTYIDSLPLPAWVKKRRDDGQFEMIMINNAYVKRYDVSKFEYVGKTDRQIWGDENAIKFEKIDQLVYDTKRRFCGKTSINDHDKNDVVDFCKFPLIIGTTDYGVGGVVVSIEG